MLTKNVFVDANKSQTNRNFQERSMQNYITAHIFFMLST